MHPEECETKIAYNNVILCARQFSRVPLRNERCEIILTARRRRKNTDYTHRDSRLSTGVKNKNVTNDKCISINE